MDEFARRTDSDRLAFINEAAARRDVTPIIIEKDYWVCWTLRRLMSVPVLADNLTFKGGTSLSKAFHIIERFSEDIDLTIGRNAPKIVDTASPMEVEISVNERKRRTQALKKAAEEYVREIALPELRGAIAQSLDNRNTWSVRVDPEDRDLQTVLFEYPTLLDYGSGLTGRRTDARNSGGGEGGYIRPRIKLEFGARGEAEPSESRAIVPYLAEVFPDELPDATVQVATLSVERTFWEKVTILHALHHGAKLLPEMSRHYYDTVKLASRGVDEAAMVDPTLLSRVVHNKTLMFTDRKASYETAIRGSLRLIPGDELREQLRVDYIAMAEMFMAEPPSFDDLITAIGVLEAKLNR
jgi:predicted nucleotidyltransferase component of viral defense system